MTDITLPREQWNLIDPHGAIRATEDTCIKAWARIDGYKPTVEGLLGYEQQGWRVEPSQPAPEPWAWATFDGEGGYDFRLYEGNESYREEYLKRNGPQYRSWVMPLYATQAQTAPKDHEVRELVNALRDVAVQHHASPQLRERIAGLIRPWAAGTQSATPASVPVGDGAQPEGQEAWQPIETAPKGVPVLLDIGGKYPIRAMLVEAKTLDAANCDDPDFGEYDEETDTHYWPAGWYEWNQHDECHWSVSETPVRWHALPAPPAVQALPARCGQGYECKSGPNCRSDHK